MLKILLEMIVSIDEYTFWCKIIMFAVKYSDILSLNWQNLNTLDTVGCYCFTKVTKYLNACFESIVQIINVEPRKKKPCLTETNFDRTFLW